MILAGLGALLWGVALVGPAATAAPIAAAPIAAAPIAAPALAKAPVVAPACVGPKPTKANPKPLPTAPYIRCVMMFEHNTERARWGVPLLVWDDGLARAAQKWATQMARTGHFDHDYAALEVTGENLWYGTRGDYVLGYAVQSWKEERPLYRPGVPFGDAASTTRHWPDISHYTQIIWRDTRRLGCGYAANRRHEYLVCRYDPGGNYEGVVAERGD